MVVKTIMSNHPNVTWFKLDGNGPKTGYTFENEGFGVCNRGSIIDFENQVLKESDQRTISVRNNI